MAHIYPRANISLVSFVSFTKVRAVACRSANDMISCRRLRVDRRTRKWIDDPERERAQFKYEMCLPVWEFWVLKLRGVFWVIFKNQKTIGYLLLLWFLRDREKQRQRQRQREAEKEGKKEMPQRHSKNNNDLAFFTYDEKRKLGYGTQKERLGKDSIKPFDACCICLQPFIEPLSCQKGHLFCKECIFECLLSQKKDIKRYVGFLSCVLRVRKRKLFDYLDLFVARKWKCLCVMFLVQWNETVALFFLLDLLAPRLSKCHVDNLNPGENMMQTA